MSARTQYQRHPRGERSSLTGVVDPFAAPPMKVWISAFWGDIIGLACMGALALGLHLAPPVPSRTFPITFQDGEIVFPQFAYDPRRQIIPVWAAVLLAACVPMLFFGIAQIRVRSIVDFVTASFGVLEAITTSAVFQVFLKWAIGGLRPHFLAVCNPVVPPGLVGTGFQQIMFNRTVCTGDKSAIDDGLEGFPSGHSTAVSAGYSQIIGLRKTFSEGTELSYWKVVAFFAPLLGAMLVIGSLVKDHHHSWYDCLAGAIIGATIGYAHFRANYHGVWDYRVNHIPLRRDGFPLSEEDTPIEGRVLKGTFTRKAGWGIENTDVAVSQELELQERHDNNERLTV